MLLTWTTSPRCNQTAYILNWKIRKPKKRRNALQYKSPAVYLSLHIYCVFRIISLWFVSVSLGRLMRVKLKPTVGYLRSAGLSVQACLTKLLTCHLFEIYTHTHILTGLCMCLPQLCLGTSDQLTENRRTRRRPLSLPVAPPFFFSLSVYSQQPQRCLSSQTMIISSGEKFRINGFCSIC